LILASLILFLLQQLVAFPHLSLFVPQGFCDSKVFNAPILNCPFIAYMLITYLFPHLHSPFGLVAHSLGICDSLEVV
jgi:hypothetical protein